MEDNTGKFFVGILDGTAQRHYCKYLLISTTYRRDGIAEGCAEQPFAKIKY
jgi:hypothetical protein